MSEKRANELWAQYQSDQWASEYDQRGSFVEVVGAELSSLQSRLGRVEGDLAERIAIETALRNRLDPVRESDSCVVDNIDRLNFEVSELKRTRDLLSSRLGDYAMMIRRLVARLHKASPHDVIASQAMIMLTKDHLQGDIARINDADVEKHVPGCTRQHEPGARCWLDEVTTEANPKWF